MAKAKDESTTAISTVPPSILRTAQASDALPDFMREDKLLGTEDMAAFITPPRIKVLQRTRDDQYSQFSEGDVIITPQNIVLAKIKRDPKTHNPLEEGEPFHIIPLLFFPEWIFVNPMETKGTEPMIVERTLDPKSPLAIKSKDPKTWSEPHPTAKTKDGGPAMRRYIECLNFIVLVLDRDGFEGLPCLMSFAKSEHRRGSSFNMLMKMRNAPIFSGIYAVQAHFRKDNPKGKWYGLDVSNPASDSGFKSFVQNPDDYAALKQQHMELKEAKINVVYDENEVTEAADSADTSQF